VSIHHCVKCGSRRVVEAIRKELCGIGGLHKQTAYTGNKQQSDFGTLQKIPEIHYLTLSRVVNSLPSDIASVAITYNALHRLYAQLAIGLLNYSASV